MTHFRDNILWLVPVLAILLDALLACQLGEERPSETQNLLPSCQHSQKDPKGLNLAHLCAEVHSGPMEDVPVIMLHGLTDSKETWDGIYQNISLLSHRKVCIYDARNHGDSPWSDTFNIDILAEDLKNFMYDKNIESAILVGHSLGGLTALKFALKYPYLVNRLFIEESPARMPDGADAVVISYVKLLKSSLTAIPDDADEDAVKKAVKDYILKETHTTQLPHYLFRKFPLRRCNGAWQWKFNIDVIIKAYQNPESFVGKMEGQYDGKVTFAYGTVSRHKITDEKDTIRKLFPKAEFVGIEGAGHTIHGLHSECLDVLIDFLK